MKSTLSVLAIGIFAAGLAAFGQSSGQATPQAQGRGRGGAPYAWGDKDKDGICDVTGKPVGQGRGQMAARGRRGMGRGMGRGMTSGMGRCCRAANAAPAQPAPAPSK
jgi:hypothetical protein